MAYVRPLVQVYQEYEELSAVAQTATLNPCIVGPCYQVVNEALNTEADLLKAFLDFYTTLGISAMEVPGLVAGAVLDTDSVKVRFTEAFADVGGTDIDVTLTGGNELTFESTAYPTGIAAGDYITVSDGDGDVLIDKAVVISTLAGTYKVFLNKTVPSGTDPVVTWLQSVPDFTLDDSDTAVTVVDSTGTVAVNAVSVTVGESSKSLYSAKVYCGYRALRQDVTEFISVASMTELEAKLGEPIPDNPLAYGVMVALANTTTSVFTLGIASDDLAGYTAAKDILEGLYNVYSIVPLTQDVGVQGMFKVHVESMSLPEKGQWRIAFGNSPLPDTITIDEGNCIIKEDTDSDAKLLFCTSADFLSNGVVAGDTILVNKTDSEELTFLVSSIVSEDTVISSTTMEGLTIDSVAYEFKILREADREMQAIGIADVSTSFASARFINVWPDVCIIDDEERPGYYLCCAIAGMVAGLPSHQGLTNISIGAISGVVNSTDYFNSSQLDIIAGGGTMVLTQLTPSSVPFIRHQLTTDRSTYEFSELSFVKNFDYVSYMCKDVLEAFIGRYNVTVSTLAILETSITGIMQGLKEYNVAKIGAPIIDFTTPVVAQDDSDKSKVTMYVAVEFPYALNLIGLHIVSSDLS